jgi:hypothetical protein
MDIQGVPRAKRGDKSGNKSIFENRNSLCINSLQSSFDGPHLQKPLGTHPAVFFLEKSTVPVDGKKSLVLGERD